MTLISIVLLAMIAAFLGLRLYSVLGKRTGHEQEPVLRRSEDRQPLPDVRDRSEPASPAAPPVDLVYEPQAETGLRALLAADRQFDAGRFLEGSKAAYRMILEAYWSGDRDTLRDLCDDDSYAAFETAISARDESGERLDNRLVTIENAKIADVSLNQGMARITVRFDADIAAVTRDRDGTVLAGSVTDAVQTHDRWTFVRALASTDPNWKLDETESD